MVTVCVRLGAEQVPQRRGGFFGLLLELGHELSCRTCGEQVETRDPVLPGDLGRADLLKTKLFENGFIDDSCGYDFLDRDARPDPVTAGDHLSHGTMMALVALRSSDHPSQAAAPTPVQILPLRVGNQSGVDGAAVVAAIDYAAGWHRRTVVNLSLGTIRSVLPAPLLTAMRRQTDLLFVVAAGNQGRRITDMRASLCRGHLENVVCVAAVDSEGRLATYPKASNFGEFVDVAAPGVDIPVTDAVGTTVTETGTSLAAAFVSGRAARLWSATPDVSAAEIARMLCAGARKRDTVDVRCGILTVGGAAGTVASGPRWVVSAARLTMKLLGI